MACLLCSCPHQSACVGVNNMGLRRPTVPCPFWVSWWRLASCSLSKLSLKRFCCQVMMMMTMIRHINQIWNLRFKKGVLSIHVIEYYYCFSRHAYLEKCGGLSVIIILLNTVISEVSNTPSLSRILLVTTKISWLELGFNAAMYF